MTEKLYCMLDGEEMGVAEDYGEEGMTLVCPRGHYWFFGARSEKMECMSDDLSEAVEGMRGEDGDN